MPQQPLLEQLEHLTGVGRRGDGSQWRQAGGRVAMIYVLMEIISIAARVTPRNSPTKEVQLVIRCRQT
eukprot:3316166-Rhodomonas_salina.1